MCRCWYELELGIPSWEGFAGPGLGSATFDGGIGCSSGCTRARTGGGEGWWILLNWKRSSCASLLNEGHESSAGCSHLPSSSESTESIVDLVPPELPSFTATRSDCPAWFRLLQWHEVGQVKSSNSLLERTLQLRYVQSTNSFAEILTLNFL